MPRPARPWFRMYAEALDNPKAQGLKPVLFKHWVNLLCLACVTRPRGTLPKLQDIAFRLRINPTQAGAVIDDLRHQGLVDWDEEQDCFVIHDWEGPEGWQYDSDTRETPGRSAADERTSRSNDRRGIAAESPRNGGDIAAVARHRADTDTEQKQNRAEPPPLTPPPPGDAAVVPLVRAFERCFGRLLSPMEIEQIKALEEEHPRDRIDYALREAAELNKRNVRYIQRICENQEASGDSHERPAGGRVAGTGGITAAEEAQLSRLGIGAPRQYVD